MASPRDKFIGLLRDDILKLALAELDFGIYRILNYRRREIDAFLDVELPRRIEEALAQLPGAASEDEQARIFHHLYTFFARYYDDGDFVTRPRRGRKAAYSVPYNGEDVHFWWATKGSHYVKSGERFASYAWRDGPRAIRIEVTDADVEKDNAKGDKRYYLPLGVAEVDGELRVQLAWRAFSAEEAKRFDKKRKSSDDDSDADDDNGADIEGKTAQERVLNDWLDGSGKGKRAIPAGVDRDLLAKHLRRYVAGQSADFFVHPQLGDFLQGELAYYLKNEFVELWDRADGDALARERGKFAVVRDVGNAIIAFLAAIEDVQAALFEKRKFVLRNDYLVRTSALPSNKAAKALVAEASDNRDQVNQWLQWLGEKPLATNVKKVSERGTALLTDYPHLCVDTRHFDEAFKYRLLATFDDLETAVGGVLIHAENYAALRTLEYAYRKRVKCIYIDPPYNADTNPIAYKNEFPESSWVSMIEERLIGARSYSSEDGVLCVTIDDYQVNELALLLERVPIKMGHLGTAAIRNNPSGRSTVHGISVCHEYAMFYGGEHARLERLPRSEKQLARFSEADGVIVDWRNFRKDGGAVTHRSQRPKQFYPIYVNVKRKSLRIPEMTWSKSDRSWNVADSPAKDEVTMVPIDEKGRERVWSLYHISARAQIDDLEIRIDKSGAPQIFRRHIPNEGVLPRSWWDKKEYAAREYGSAALSNFFDVAAFSFAKSPFAVQDCIWVSGLSEDSDALALDYFAGSGTTGHAVINLNRDDGGARQFVLVEQGEYFDTVLLPRIAKVIAAPEWKEGKPKPGQSMQPADGDDDDAHWSERSPALVQVIALERYEDSLDALELPAEADARHAGQHTFAGDTLLRYVYEASAGAASVALNTARLSRPFDYSIPQSQQGRRVLAKVDLAATALVLLGLHAVRVRNLDGKAGRNGQRWLLIEARPNGKPTQLDLLVFRDVDENLAGDALRKHAQAEATWLATAVQREFELSLGDYSTIWHNRDLVVDAGQARSLDGELARRMLERAPQDRSA